MQMLELVGGTLTGANCIPVVQKSSRDIADVKMT